MPSIAWLDNSTFKHLRFHFSFFLMPVFLFALSQANDIHWNTALIGFLILHFLIFPSSNGYNSYQDRDETSIGGMKHPPKVTKNLFYVTLIFDIVGVTCGLFISVYFSVFVMVFVLMSRAYSYRKIRLKKYAIIGFITVFVFQGAFVFLISSSAITSFSFDNYFTVNNLFCMGIASLFIGSAYPLTQIYQHDADKKDGVISISYKLGYNGTFVFSAILFSLATILLAYYFELKNQLIALLIFTLLMLPIVTRLSVWFNKVRRDVSIANFENTMRMNLMNSVCMNLFFGILILNRFWNWF
ncbi:MAG: UbiA family prenyltransferase [Bacteroidales bacterium]|nr:UbiA family prenyltransferase [Bacteroidales bacterium]